MSCSVEPFETSRAKRVALVTGANKGLGLELCRRLASADNVVYLAARNPTRGLEACRLLNEQGLAVRFVQLDVTDHASIGKAASQIEHEVGHLDVLVNNAGVAMEGAPASSANLDLLRRTLETNFIGPVAVVQGMLALLRKSPTRIIVNISSDVGSLTLQGDRNHANFAKLALAYTASKTALNAFTVVLAKELADEGFRVNAVHPGFTATDLNHHKGTQNLSEGTDTAFRFATFDDQTTGGFFGADGPIPW